MSRAKVPKLLSLLYTQNPFYLISTCLFVYGLKLLFRSGDSAMLFQRGDVDYMEPWGLMTSFAALTLLMAVTGVLVVRLGQVWEDGRSLVLIVLLMLLAMAVSIDELLIELSDADFSRSRLYQTLLSGVGFALVVSEFLTRCLRIKFPYVLRLPLYGFLVLFFLWPALLLPEWTGFSAATTRWLIAAFPTVAAVLTLTLIPAIRRTSAAVTDNGTPWGWPLFPWTPFIFVAAAVCLRSYFLTMSFDVVSLQGHYWDTIFGVYQLVPFFLAIAVLLLEIGRVEKMPWLQHVVLLLAPLLLALSYPRLAPWSRLPSYTAFTDLVVAEVASPVFLTAIVLTLIYGWAWRSGVRYGEIGFTLMMLVAAFIGVRGTDFRALSPQDFNGEILLLIGTLHMFRGLWHRTAVNLLLGLLLLVFVGRASVGQMQLELVSVHWVSLLTMHAVVAAGLIAAMMAKDSLAGLLQVICAPMIWLLGLRTVATMFQRDVSVVVLLSYLVGSGLLLTTLWWLWNNRAYLWAAAADCLLVAVATAIAAVHGFRTATMAPGARHLIVGLACFAVAVLISMAKAGLARRIRKWNLTRRRAVRTG